MAATQEQIDWVKSQSIASLIDHIIILRIDEVFDYPQLCQIGGIEKQEGFVQAVYDGIYRDYGKSPVIADGQSFAKRFVLNNSRYTIGDIIYFGRLCAEEYEIDYLNIAQIFKHWRIYLQYRGKEESRIMADQERASERQSATRSDIPTPEEQHAFFEGVISRMEAGMRAAREFNTQGPPQLPGVTWSSIVSREKYMQYSLTQQGIEQDKNGEWHHIDEQRMAKCRRGWEAMIIAPAVQKYTQLVSHNNQPYKHSRK